MGMGLCYRRLFNNLHFEKIIAESWALQKNNGPAVSNLFYLLTLIRLGYFCLK